MRLRTKILVFGLLPILVLYAVIGAVVGFRLSGREEE